MDKELIEKYMRIAIEEAMIAKEEGENPFGAVLLDSNYNFCGKAHSQSIKLCDPTAHAEVLVIRNYCNENNLVYLKDYTLICSSEPCVMCSGAIHWSKIQNIYYSVPQEKLNKISGGKKKPSCDSLINTGHNKRNIVGNILLEEGLKVFENYEFIPQDERKSNYKEKFYLEIPTIERKNDALDYIEEFYKYDSQIHGTGSLDRELKKGITYEEWLSNNINLHDESYASKKGLVPAYTYFLVRENDNKIVGMIDLRLGLNDFLRNYGGHIGYSIRPTERRKGYNKINLYLCLQKAKNNNLDKVLITCADYNEGSKKTIKSFDGSFEKNTFDESSNETMELYWIDVNEVLKKYKDIFEPYILNK